MLLRNPDTCSLCSSVCCHTNASSGKTLSQKNQNAAMTSNKKEKFMYVLTISSYHSSRQTVNNFSTVCSLIIITIIITVIIIAVIIIVIIIIVIIIITGNSVAFISVFLWSKN